MDYASMIVGIIRYYEKKAQLAEFAFLENLSFRAVASGGCAGGQLPPPDLLSQTNQVCGRILFSLDSLILIVVTCKCLPLSWLRNWLVDGVCKY